MNRFKIHEDSNNINYRLNYTGIEDRVWEPEKWTVVTEAKKLLGCRGSFAKYPKKYLRLLQMSRRRTSLKSSCRT